MATNRNKKKYIITHSNYTVKETHKRLDRKTIYENDYTILTDNGSYDRNNPIYGSPTFRMVSSNHISETKKYKYGNWIKNNGCDSWTIDGMSNQTGVTEESAIVKKPNSNSLLDFAYYGSCTELIRTTMSNIIENFPGEIYVKDKKVYNPFNINIHNGFIPYSLKGKVNELRYFTDEIISKYEIISGSTTLPITGWQISKSNTTFTIKISSENAYIELNVKVGCNTQEITSKTGGEFRIRPKQEIIEEYFNNLDDFEKIVLNRTSVPLYTMELDYPHETEYGVSTYRKFFTWPTKYGYNLDFESVVYEKYLTDLLDLANFYDERKTNNLWRSMVHDSIKNMDLTYINGNTNEDSDDYGIGVSKFEGLLMAYGRQFDEIKRDIDTLKSVNNITYDNNNNIPAYFLSDKLELSGWEVYNTSPTNNQSIKVGNFYSGTTKLYSGVDANIEFLKNLQINSKNILSRKGTRNGIEMILSLFGLKSRDFVNLYKKENSTATGLTHDYEITEYVNVVNGVNEDIVEKVELYNSMKKNFEYESDEGTNMTNMLQGLPVREVIYSGGTYLIPWFNNLEEIDGNPYFQMYGGWGKIPKKYIDGEINVITANTDSGNTIYDETCKYLKVVKKIKDLAKAPSTLKNGDIYYVSDISDFDSVYLNGNSANTITLESASNYFIIENAENDTLFGETGDGEKGWINIPIADITGSTGNGFKVLYIESIIEDSKGNNPHCGYGRYDDGAGYLEYFKQLFKHSLETDNFTAEAYDCSGLTSEISTLGFSGLFNDDGSVNYIKDNMKTWYFTDEQTNIQTSVKVGKLASGFTWTDSELIPYNFENSANTTDEAASYSIINNKKLKITFSPIFSSEEGYNYLYNSILPYLKQMIPSTTLLEIEVETD